jgi:tellurite resistance protein TehA-like permease
VASSARYILLAFSVLLMTMGAVWMGLAYRYRPTVSKGVRRFSVAQGLFYGALGLLALAGFITSGAAARWLVLSIGVLYLTRSAGLLVAKRYLQRRAGSS